MNRRSSMSQSSTGKGRLVDTMAAAVAVGRTPATIRGWIHRGKINNHGKDKHGRTLVDLAEVYRTAQPNKEKRPCQTPTAP